MSTAPIFAPDGSLGDIPAGQLAAAVKAGAKPGVNIISPDGKPGVVPADRYVDAVKAGAKVAPFEDQDIKHPGFWSALVDDAKAMFSGPNQDHWQSGRAGAATQLNEQQQQQSADEDAARQAAGRSGAYRAVAPIAEGLSNVPGQEKSAAEGDTMGVLGHAALTPLMMAISEGLTRGVPPVAKAATAALKDSPVGSIPVRLAARSAEAAANQKLVPVRPILNIMTPADEAEAVQVKIPGRDFGLPEKPLDATAENVPYAGEKSPRARQALRNGTQSVVNQAIPAEGDTLALNKRVQSQVENHLSQGNVEAAENVLDTAAKKADPKYSPPDRPRITPSVQNIRERIAQVNDAEAAPNRPTPDSMEDRALQQEMNQDLERHGWAAESAARREFIARNSTGVTKSELTGAAEKPVKYTKTPAVPSPGTGAVDDLTDLLQKSLEAAKQAKEKR